MVVEGNAGPLMLSPSGQFITPSSCPVSLLVSFITDNLDEARARLDKHGIAVEKEKHAIAECVEKVIFITQSNSIEVVIIFNLSR